jgi:DNA-binding transcriptional MerR regulator
VKIGELAQVAQCTVETVRYYEKEGLLSAPARTRANYRSYGELHVERLRFYTELSCPGYDACGNPHATGSDGSACR